MMTGLALPALSDSIAPIVSPENPTTIQIGMLLPLTGSLSETGATAKAALEVAIEDFQRQFPTATIQPFIVDTASDPATALAQLKTLAAQGIKIYIGPFSSAEVIAMKPFVDENKLVLISPITTAPSLAVDDTIFRIALDDTKQAIALSALIAKRKVTAIVPIVRNDIYGKEFVENFIAQFQKVGGTTANPIYYDAAAPDLQSAVNQAKTAVESLRQQNANASIGVVAISFDEIVDLFTKASGDSTLSSLPWFGTDGSAQNANVEKNPTAAAFAEKTQYTASVSSDYNVVSYPYLPFMPINENLITKVMAKIPSPNHSKVAPTYDALWTAGMACFNPNASLKEEVIRVSQVSVGYMGSIYFGPTGDRGYGWFSFYRFMNGKWILNAAYVFTEFQTIPEPLTEYLFDFADKALNFKIGVLLSLTGSYSSYGQEMLKALQKAETDINTIIKRYYASTSKAEFVIEDTQTDPEVAYQKLVSMKEKGIQFVIGPETSAEVERVASYANQNGIIMVSPSSTSMSLAQKDYIFRLALNDEKHCSSLATLMMVEGISYAQVIYRNDTFGSGFNDYFTKDFTALGGVCGEAISYDPTTTDYQSVVAKAEANITQAAVKYGTNKIAILFVAYDEAIPFMETISSTSILGQVRWFGTDGFCQSPLFAQSAKAGKFAAQTKLTASTLGTDVDAMLIYQQVMANDLTLNLGSEIRAFDVAAYDAAWLIAQFCLFSDWYPSADAVARVTNLASIASMTASYLATNYLDDNGDRIMGSVVFYQVSPTDTSVKWKKYAAFVFYMGQQGPMYYGKNPASNVLFAPELK